MSDENQEVLEEDILEDAVEETGEDLQEFKADKSDSEVPEATAVKAKPLPGSKSQGDKKPMTKMGMISAMVGMMGKESKEAINAMYGDMKKKEEVILRDNSKVTPNTAKILIEALPYIQQLSAT